MSVNLRNQRKKSWSQVSNSNENLPKTNARPLMETERNFFILQRCGPGEAADFDLACANVLRCLRSASARFLASLRWRSHHSHSFFGWANLLFPLAIIGSTHGVVDAAAAVAGPGTAVTPDELLLAAAAKVATLTDKASTVLLSTWF